MQPAVDAFLERLTSSGLMGPDEVEALRASTPTAERDSATLARELVESGRLTSYQANALMDGRTRNLTLGSYVVLEPLSSGGMGEVYKAMHRKLERIVAIKVLPPALLGSEEASRRFLREAKVSAKLVHPHVVQAYDADEVDGVHFLVLEYVDGHDLGRVLEREGPMPVAEAVDATLQAARGLAYAHEQGVVHRDVKPANLIRDAHGTVKVLDLGLARIHGSDDMTQTGHVLGTVDTMAPEAAEDSRRADARSDVYSLGCTLYALLAGRHAYARESMLRTLEAHRTEATPSIRAVRPDVPPALDAVLLRMMAKDPDDRIPDMGAVVAALEGLTALPSEAAPRVPKPIARPGRPAPTVDRRRFAWALLGLPVLVAGALTVWSALRSKDDTPPADRPARVGGPESSSPPEARFRVTWTGHGDVVNDLVFSADGEVVASASHDGTVRLWRVGAPSATRVLRGNGAPLRSVLFLDDDARLAASTNTGPILVWDLAGKEPPETWEGHSDKVRRLALTPDGRRLASASKDGSLRLWDVATGAEVDRGDEHGPGRDDSRGLLGVAISADGGRIATTGYDRTVRIWRLDPLGVERTLGPHDTDVGAVAWAPDGTRLAYDLDMGKIRLVDGATGNEERVLPGHNGWVMAMAFSPDGRMLATGGEDDLVRLWDAESGSPLQVLEGHEGTVTAVAFSPDGSRMATGSGDQTIKLWDLVQR